MDERLKQIKERLAMLTGEWEAGRGVAVRPDQLTADIAWLIEQLEDAKRELRLATSVGDVRRMFNWSAGRPDIDLPHDVLCCTRDLPPRPCDCSAGRVR